MTPYVYTVTRKTFTWYVISLIRAQKAPSLVLLDSNVPMSHVSYIPGCEGIAVYNIMPGVLMLQARLTRGF